MGHIKDIKSNLDPQAFPGATFEIAGEVPAPQCSEAKLEGDHGETWADTNAFRDPNKFIGWALVGKKLTITSPPPQCPTYDITANDGTFLLINPNTPAASPDNVYYVHNGGSLILTRDVPSFTKFIHAAGYAYTIKGGKLYTNMPSAQLKDACTILFDPLT
ncbi:hypothetical protein ES703_109938 [subsurface metagenome]